MSLSRSWSYPADGTPDVGHSVTWTAESGGPGFSAALDSLQVPNIITAPANSASLYAPASYTANTASVATVVQNTLGYDAQYVAYFQGAASVATFQVGVGSSATPNMTTVVSSISNTTVQPHEFSAYVPADYYFSWQVTRPTEQACHPRVSRLSRTPSSETARLRVGRAIRRALRHGVGTGARVIPHFRPRPVVTPRRNGGWYDWAWHCSDESRKANVRLMTSSGCSSQALRRAFTPRNLKLRCRDSWKLKTREPHKPRLLTKPLDRSSRRLETQAAMFDPGQPSLSQKTTRRHAR